VLRNKLTTIAMSSVQEQLAHTTLPQIVLLCGSPDSIGVHRIKHSHFYFIRVWRYRHVWHIKLPRMQWQI